MAVNSRLNECLKAYDVILEDLDSKLLDVTDVLSHMLEEHDAALKSEAEKKPDVVEVTDEAAPEQSITAAAEAAVSTFTAEDDTA